MSRSSDEADEEKFGSPLRSLMTQAHGASYSSAQSLDEAKARPGYFAILEGDYGGTVYLIVPVALIECSEKTLADLLYDIDDRYWRDPDGCQLSFELRSSGEHVAGGMGGGRTTDGLWMHPEIEAFGVRHSVRDVLAGQADKLTG